MNVLICSYLNKSYLITSDCSGKTATKNDGDLLSFGQTDLSAEIGSYTAAGEKPNTLDPSRKKSRFSWKKRGNLVRFTLLWSTSTSAKSVLTEIALRRLDVIL